MLTRHRCWGLLRRPQRVVDSGVHLREPGVCICSEDRVARAAGPVEALVTPLTLN